MAEHSLKAGVARAVITPPVGIPMSGFAGRDISEDVHDDLTATVLVLEGDSWRGDDRPSRLVLVCCDLLSLNADIVKRVRSAVRARGGAPEHTILIAASHTHYGPVTASSGLTASGPRSPLVEPYMDNLVNCVAGLVTIAERRLTDSRLYAGKGTLTIGVNRRERTEDGRIVLGQNPDGPFDPRVAVLRVDGSDGAPVAAIVNYACHPVSLGSKCRELSADYPAVARQVVENETGATALFLQGAAGDVNPLLMGYDWKHVSQSGQPLGDEAVHVYRNADQVGRGNTVATKTKALQLPPILPESVETALDQIASLERRQKELDPDGTAGQLYWITRRLDRLHRGLAVLEGRAVKEPVEAEITAAALGSDIGLITAPGEIFTTIGHDILARSPFTHTLYAGYTDGSIHYVPTRDAYNEGGYEVTNACDVAPEAGEILEEESIGLLEAVYAMAASRTTTP